MRSRRSGRTTHRSAAGRPAAALLLPAVLLAGCTGGTASDGPGPSAADGAGPSADCGPGDRIGAALPQGPAGGGLAAPLAAGLSAAGFVPDVEPVGGTDPQTGQPRVVDRMLADGAKVLLLGPVPGAALATGVATAESLGVPVIALERPIDAEGLDALVAFDALQAGRAQGQALLDGLALRQGSGPYRIELFAAAQSDPSDPAAARFNGAMEVLQPRIDEGTLAVASGETSFAQASVPGGADAARRMADLLSAAYPEGLPLHGVLAPTDEVAEAVLGVVAATGRAPVVTGAGADAPALARIGAGTQFATLLEDPGAIAETAVAVVQAVCAGDPPGAGSTVTTGSGLRVDAVLVDSVLVTQENAEVVLASDPQRLAAVRGG
jgi:putative multiple sugar transport system substrate-binding protein